MAEAARHSEDRVEVWHGLSTPAIACGFHAEHFPELVFEGHQKLMARNT